MGAHRGKNRPRRPKYPTIYNFFLNIRNISKTVPNSYRPFQYEYKLIYLYESLDIYVISSENLLFCVVHYIAFVF